MASQPVTSGKFSSLYEMEAMANLESRLRKTLSDFIIMQREKLQLLTGKLDWLKEVRPPEMSTEEVISDPINAYLLVKRLTRDWPLILNLMMHSFGKQLYFDMQDDLSQLPKEEDFQSAVRGLARLHQVYGASDAGLTRTPEGSGGLTAQDFFELGKYMFNDGDHEKSMFWFNRTMQKIANNDLTVSQDRVLPHLFLSSLYSDCKSGAKSGSASKVLQSLVTQYPKHTLDTESSPLFREALSGSCPNKSNENTAHVMYENVCRGVGLNYSSELRCFYLHHNNPRLLIAPFKMEEINIDPPLLMFHNVISDDEIKEMKEAFIEVRETGKVGLDNRVHYHRTCDVGWVKDEYSEVSARLSLRVGDMTNLDMESSEVNQVASYSLGGEFREHYDTVPSQLSDVEKGGFTAFTRLGTAVRPMKGSAVFWFNVDAHGGILNTTLHGGCPVLTGSKWVLNKWIREDGQKPEIVCPVDEKFPKPRYYLNMVQNGG